MFFEEFFTEILLKLQTTQSLLQSSLSNLWSVSRDVAENPSMPVLQSKTPTTIWTGYSGWNIPGLSVSILKKTISRNISMLERKKIVSMLGLRLFNPPL